MTINRKVEVAMGDKTVDVTGYKYFKITHGRPTISYTKGGSTVTMPGVSGAVTLPEGLTSITVKTDPFPHFWRLEMRDHIPVDNLAELKVVKQADGNYFIYNDEDIVLLGQDVDQATVDISGIRPDFDALGRLFNEALSTGNAMTAAKYIKLKTKLIG